MSYQGGVYNEQGTGNLVAPSGKEIRIESGAKVNVETGGQIVQAGEPATVDIALAASATTDGMDVTLTVEDGNGDAVAGVHLLECWISEAATGIGLTADSYSGDLTVTTGTEWQEIVTKKHYRLLTDVNGVAVFTVVDSANPADQYVAVVNPVNSQIIVSAVSGTNWEGV